RKWSKLNIYHIFTSFSLYYLFLLVWTIIQYKRKKQIYMKSDYPYIKKQKPYLMFHGIILQLWINTNEINNKKVQMKNPLFLFVFPMNCGMESVILIIKL